MDRKHIFNIEGSDSIEDRCLVGGNSSNLINLNSIKYKWASQLYATMQDNFWRPRTVNMSTDKTDYSKLTKEERRAYNGILSFLIFLDSIQVQNLPNISSYITAPEVTLALSVHAMHEANHSESYQYIIESVIPVNKREGIYEFAKTDKKLATRNAYIASIYQNFITDPSVYNFYMVLLGNYLLESLYFYQGFQFFFNLASRNLMPGTSSMIRYIRTDELTHVALFQNIIKELPDFVKILGADNIKSIFEEAVRQEIDWSTYIIGDSILGFNEESIVSYTKHLANTSYVRIGLGKLYLDTTNPYEHLELIGDNENKGTSKGNFFEVRSTNYSQPTSLNGFDDL